jgi:hypothetical protein
MTDTDELARVPQACTLPTADQPSRLAEFDDLFATALRGQRRVSPTAMHWEFDSKAEATVRDLTARENSCCSFFSFVYGPAGDVLELDVEVPVAHVEALDALEARAAARMRP